MSDIKQPMGYGHDKKGAAGGETKNDGRVGVVHAVHEHGEACVTFKLDGRDVHAHDGETIWQVAKREGIDIPHLCYSPDPGYRADGNCRACMVEIEGERVLAASCIRKPAEGMKVNVSNHRAETARKMIFDLLVSDQPRARDLARSGVEVLELGRQDGGRDRPLPRAREDARGGPQPCRDGGQSRRLHPVQSLRPRLP